MESLYTKYRPQTFADVVGQSHVVTTLEHAVMGERTSHAYLFCGPRGTGKTTMARLLAKALMCEQGVGHLPDGTCEQCRLIAAGEHPDVYELDAASRTGVDNVRDEIISRVSFAPVRAPYKMYIIDEVHMLTTAAFNALLKTLEEPPSHVVFVLCTTDPQKIPETILSRVQRFDFHAIGNADIQARLTHICDREGFGYDPEALELVVRHARGGMRDAISELEQLSVSGGGSITVDVARDVLGEVAASTLERTSLAMANRDVPTLFAQVESLVEVGRDLLQFTRALAARLRDVYVVAAVGAKSGALQSADDELPAISREAAAFGSVDRVARALGLLSDASTEMRVATNQRLVLEVALTKVARPESELTLEALADRIASLERQVVALSAPGTRHVQPSVPGVAPASQGPEGTSAPTVPEGRGDAPAERTGVSSPVSRQQKQKQQQRQKSRPETPAAEPTPQPAAPVEEPCESRVTPSRATAPSQPSAPRERPSERQVARQAPQTAPAPTPTAMEPDPAPVPTSTGDPGELQRLWRQVVDGLLASRPQHGSLLMSSTLVSDDGHRLLVSLPKGSSFACRMLERTDVRASIDPAVNSVFGQRTTLFAEDGAPADPVATSASPAAGPAVTRRERAGATPTEPAAPAAAPVPASREAPAREDGPLAIEPSTPSAPAFSAPWEPESAAGADDHGIDLVSHDDLDTSPYEEDLGLDVPVGDWEPVPSPVPPAGPTPAEAAPSVPAAGPVPAPTPDPVPAPAPAKAPAAPKAKRASRTAAGIPADIVSMMTEVFGEGVSYSAKSPTDDLDLDPDVGADPALADDPALDDGFTDEPVDDADFEYGDEPDN